MATQIDGVYELQPTPTDEHLQQPDDCPEASTPDRQAAGTIEDAKHSCCHYPKDLARRHPRAFCLWLALLLMAIALVATALTLGRMNPRPEFMNKQDRHVITERCMPILTRTFGR